MQTTMYCLTLNLTLTIGAFPSLVDKKVPTFQLLFCEYQRPIILYSHKKIINAKISYYTELFHC